jgi:hypothetical protein
MAMSATDPAAVVSVGKPCAAEKVNVLSGLDLSEDNLLKLSTHARALFQDRLTAPRDVVEATDRFWNGILDIMGTVNDNTGLVLPMVDFGTTMSVNRKFLYYASHASEIDTKGLIIPRIMVNLGTFTMWDKEPTRILFYQNIIEVMIFGTTHLIMAADRPGKNIDVHKHNAHFEVLCRPLGIGYQHGYRQSYKMIFNWSGQGILQDCYHACADKLAELRYPLSVKQSKMLTDALAKQTAPVTGEETEDKPEQAKTQIAFHYKCSACEATITYAGKDIEVPDTPFICPRCHKPMENLTALK